MKNLVGQTLGRYRIETLLGSGRMGQVFRGRQVRLDQPAAIKVVHSHLATTTFRTRFLVEMGSVVALKDPHIVEIYEFGEQDELLYLTMELMTEGTLSQLLRQRAIKRFEALIVGLDLVRQAAEGLDAAHAAGIIHQDIKPDNLLLNRLSSADQGSEQYQLKISDFGLARLNESTSGLVTGEPAGTPAYMSPEQCQNQTLDGRSDLYSLGVVLYEVVTGYLPFQINGFNDAMQKHVNAEPLPPREVRPDLPPFVEQIILRSLAKRPEDRYQTGKELASALQEAISHAALQTMAPLLPASPDAPKSPPVTSPRIRVADLTGQTIQVVEVTRKGLIIGRQNDCDVVLSAETVSRRHLQVKWDGKRTTVTDLRSSYGTKLGNQKLVPQVGRVWEQQQTVTVGPFSLYLEMPEVPKVAEKKPVQPLYSEHLPQVRPSLARSSRIGVRVQPDKLSITPGQPAETKVTLVNLGKTVDWFSPFVENVDPGWVQGQGQEVHLNPGMQKEVDLRVKVAKAPENLAQEYPVTIRVHSREKPGEYEAVQALWTVLPFWDDRLKVEPGKARGRGAGNYTVTLQNNGNISERYELGCEDAEQKLTYQFKPGHEVSVEPGKQAKLPLKVKTRRFWLGPEQPNPFQIHATPATKRGPQTRNAELVNRALIPGWLLPIVGALLALALVLLLVLALLIPRGSQGNVASTLTPTSINVPTAAPTLEPTTTPTLEPTVTPTPVPLPQGPKFTSFTDDSKSSMQLNDSATIGSSVLELTPAQQNKAGSAYFKQPIDPSQSFHTQFQFFLHDGTNPPADGFSFVVQNSSKGDQAVGDFGAGLGYVHIPQSVAVTFAVYRDGHPSDQLGFEQNGDPTTFKPSANPPPALYEKQLNAWIDYDAPSQMLQVYVDAGSTKPSSPLLTANVNMAALGKSAFVGFTGGTGFYAAAQDILNWRFTGGGLA